jgi:hypothetical protein
MDWLAKRWTLVCLRSFESSGKLGVHVELSIFCSAFWVYLTRVYMYMLVSRFWTESCTDCDKS